MVLFTPNRVFKHVPCKSMSQLLSSLSGFLTSSRTSTRRATLPACKPSRTRSPTPRMWRQLWKNLLRTLRPPHLRARAPHLRSPGRQEHWRAQTMTAIQYQTLNGEWILRRNLWLISMPPMCCLVELLAGVRSLKKHSRFLWLLPIEAVEYTI